jgi:hypothetical protein
MPEYLPESIMSYPNANPDLPGNKQLHDDVAVLSFPDPLEDNFRRHYSNINANRAQMLPVVAILMTMFGISIRLSRQDPGWSMILFDLFVFLPLLFSVLHASQLPDRHRLYQSLLAASVLISGLVITSIVIRANLHGVPYYFAMEIAWIFGIWLIAALRFRRTVVITLLISFTHVVGVIKFGTDFQQTGFECVMLVLVNAVGATSSYQMEMAERKSFLASRKPRECVSDRRPISHAECAPV